MPPAPAPPAPNPPPRIHRMSTLPNMPSPAMAIHLLHRAAAEAAFLLPQRGWTVGHLSEFYPPTANLLGINVNRGAAIRVRLRSPTAPSSFLDYDSVLSTLLHEFAHIAVGPHDVRFYTVLGELKAAVEGARIRAAGMASVGVYLPTEGRPAEAAAAAAAKSRAAAAASGGGKAADDGKAARVVAGDAPSAVWRLHKDV
ncbi:hypothetical protein I4F81_000856 [Pyropia yezoensis]|uniref:Uncharacterized protein n=1 Tax=Pyropia yezoensis TaxID=2788 RepID=A0ACC3BKG8_PYRYE|nr:hypothetical protein I4F81_000856 [Neopyropia yezoensis]